MKKIFCFAMFAIALSCALQAAPVNRYGMKLQEKDGKYIVPDSVKFDNLGILWRTLPDVLVPYKPAGQVFDKQAVETIVPDTLIYKTNAAGNKLPMLVYRSSKPVSPVVFFIHGGGWKAGSCKDSAPFCKTLSGKYGYTVVSVEYTFATVPGTKMENTIQDCYDAVDYILSRASEFNADPQRIAFMGGSAGGHLSACCAMHFPQTKALAGWYGAYDLIQTMNVYAPVSNAPKHAIFDTFFNGWNEKYIKKCSPYIIAGKSRTNFKAILFEGTADITIGPGNAEKFRKALAASGNNNVEVHSFENITHSMFASYVADEIYLSTLNLFLSTL